MNVLQTSTTVMKMHSVSTLWVGTTVFASLVIQEMALYVKVNYQKHGWNMHVFDFVDI